MKHNPITESNSKMDDTLKSKERELIKEVLNKTGWDLDKASRLLKISLARVKRKIVEHGLKRPDSL